QPCPGSYGERRDDLGGCRCAAGLDREIWRTADAIYRLEKRVPAQGYAGRAAAGESPAHPLWAHVSEAGHTDLGCEFAPGQRQSTAMERALALDPNLIFAASQLVTNLVERRESAKAYKQASDLIKRHPENAQAHFAMSYVLRYAGMLEQSAQ